MNSLTKDINCYLCGSINIINLDGNVRDDKSIPILKCSDCDLVFLGKKDHINKDYYKKDYTEENLGNVEWQELINICYHDDIRRSEQLKILVKNKKYLDVGCGAGGTLIHLKDKCKQAIGIEPNERWRKELKIRGVNTFSNIEEVKNNSQDVISLFHVLEHIAEPINFLKTIKQKAKNKSQIIIEVPNSDDALITLYKNKAFLNFTYWSPHLFYYNEKTLKKLLEKSGFKTEKIVISQFQRYTLSNHLMWLSNNVPGGHEIWSFLDSPSINEQYSSKLGSLGKCDTIIAWVTV